MRGGAFESYDQEMYDTFSSRKKRNVPFRFRQITGDGKGGLNKDDIEFLGHFLEYYREKNEEEKKEEEKKLQETKTKQKATNIDVEEKKKMKKKYKNMKTKLKTHIQEKYSH